MRTARSSDQRHQNSASIPALVLAIAGIACGDDSGTPDVSDVAAGDHDELPDTADAGPATPGLDVVFLMRESIDELRLRERLRTHVARALPSWFGAVPELRVGVLGTDLGFRDAADRVCSERGSGAVLRRELGICNRAEYFVDQATSNAGSELACLMERVPGVCGIEQPLETTLAAISTEADPYRFFGNSRTEGEVGLGETLNAGFRRPDVPLLLVIPTTEDDCSFISRTFFANLTENFRVRCSEQSEGLYPTDSYVEALSEQAPAGVHLFLLAGLPTDLVDRPVADIAADDRLAYEYDPATQQPVISCRSDSLGRAFPPTRLVNFGAQLEAQGTNRVAFGSMCDDTAVEASFDRLDAFVAEVGVR